MQSSRIRLAKGSLTACVKGILLAYLGLLLLAMPEAVASEGTLPRAKPEDVGFSPDRVQRINDVIRRHIEEHRIAGAVTLVGRRGAVVHFEAHGLMDLDSKRPMRTDTLFRMASSTKPVTGVAVMMLVEEGKIRLSDPVSKFIPEFKEMKVAVRKDGESDVQLVPADRAITIRDLLTHTSGLATGGLGTQRMPRDSMWPKPDDALATLIPRLAAFPLDFQPGTRWRYSGLAGLDVLGRVVEIASGHPYDEFLERRVFEPLGMKDTFFDLPADRQDRLATVYRGTDKGLEKSAFTLRFPKTYFSGAGGLVSDAEDYFRFGQSFISNPRTGRRLLSPRAVELFSSNHVGEMFPGQLGRPKGMGFGLSVEVVVDSVQAATFRSNGSFGWDGAFGTHFWVDPKEQLVGVLLVQAMAGPVVAGIQRDFETAVMQAIVE
jgi:CubicO group peptidase (beta-lactamase class C family)